MIFHGKVLFSGGSHVFGKPGETVLSIITIPVDTIFPVVITVLPVIIGAIQHCLS